MASFLYGSPRLEPLLKFDNCLDVRLWLGSMFGFARGVTSGLSALLGTVHPCVTKTTPGTNPTDAKFDIEKKKNYVRKSRGPRVI